MSKTILLAGPFVGEIGWELLRFAPYVIHKKVKHYKNNVKLVVCTRKDRFDLYGEYADELIPLDIEGDYTKLKCDCFRLIGYDITKYDKLVMSFRNKYDGVLEHIFPKLHKKMFAKKDQFNWNEMIHDFKPRPNNKILIDNLLPKKDSIILSPRYRKGFKRNWPYWEKLYDLIEKDSILKNYCIIICGKTPEYLPDPKNRFIDINSIEQTEGTSLVGLTIEAMKRSRLTVGTQSGLPNLSNLLGTHTLQWGHEYNQHKTTYNVKKTKCKFIRDQKYNVNPERILNEMRIILSGKKENIK